MLQCVHACGCAESVVSTLAGRSDGCLGCKSFTPEFVRSSWRNCWENPTTTQQRLIFESFESYCYAHFSTSHRGKTHCFSRKTGSTCTWVCSCVCAGSRGKQNARPAAHFNTIHRQFRLNSPTLRLRAADSHLIPNRREEETTSADYFCIVAADKSQTGVFVEDWMDRSSKGKQGIHLHLTTCCGPLIHKKDLVSRVMWCQ